MGREIFRRFLPLILPALLVTGCEKAVDGRLAALYSGREAAYYLTGTPEQKEIFADLFTLLAERPDPGEDQFAVVREIANRYMRLGEYGRLVSFLNSWVIKFPQDPYCAYYLLQIAHAYIRQESPPVAARYFDLIVKNYPDLTVNGESIHLACLRQLVTLVDNPEQRVWYYNELISRFPEKTDLGAAWFMLAQAYEQTGEWNSAIQTYTQYLSYVGTIVPGFPDADIYAKRIVDFSKSPKDWTFENLNGLVGAIKRALDGGSSGQLWAYHAKVNFFTRSWGQAETDDAGMAEFSISNFMRGNPIRYAAALDAGSNANEAYLRTWGWAQISTWYFYFRKIYFPPDPEIHGRWEWAGVYYGEKF
jgi:tetratricopeptide (TPR) repeat protein